MILVIFFSAAIFHQIHSTKENDHPQRERERERTQRTSKQFTKPKKNFATKIKLSSPFCLFMKKYSMR